MEKIRKRLSSGSIHTYPGRLTLDNATLSNLPIYFLSLFSLSAKVANELDKIVRKLLRKGATDKQGQNLVRWDLVQKPIGFGGPGMISFKAKNKALLAKRNLRFLTEDSALWTRLIHARTPFRLL